MSTSPTMQALFREVQKKSAPPIMPSPIERAISQFQWPVEQHFHKWAKPAEWRDLSFWHRAICFHDAASALGNVHAFSLNLRPDVERLAGAQASAASWLQKRIGAKLREAFGRRVDFWFVLEETDCNRRLHLHGELVVTAERVASARSALRAAGGRWAVARQHQAHTESAPDDGWITYVIKNRAYSSKNSPAAHLRTFAGENFAATTGLRSCAAEMYERDRMLVTRQAPATAIWPLVPGGTPAGSGSARCHPSAQVGQASQ